MKFFAKCVAVFLILTVLLTVMDLMLLNTTIPLSPTILFSAFSSLIITMIYGWIDAVYIKQRQPVMDDE